MSMLVKNLLADQVICLKPSSLVPASNLYVLDA